MRSETEAVVRVSIRSQARQPLSVEAVVDTGFDGFLSMPPSTIGSLALVQIAEVFAELANGEEAPTRVFEAEAEWDGRAVPIEVAEFDCEPLLGMRLLAGYHLGIDVTNGGRVEIRLLRR
ncbi:MAG TPA: clan AA aspartic protease [Phycisphaerae bacterium]